MDKETNITKCFVPNCANILNVNDRIQGAKLFTVVPNNRALRTKWLLAIKCDIVEELLYKHLVCCEDHFERPADFLTNSERYFSVRGNIFPHIFKLTSKPDDIVYVDRKLLITKIQAIDKTATTQIAIPVTKANQKVEFFDFSHSCCLCLKDNIELQPIEKQDPDGVDFLTKINTCIYEKTPLQPVISLSICVYCSYTLELAYQFKMHCLNYKQYVMPYSEERMSPVNCDRHEEINDDVTNRSENAGNTKSIITEQFQVDPVRGTITKSNPNVLSTQCKLPTKKQLKNLTDKLDLTQNTLNKRKIPPVLHTDNKINPKRTKPNPTLPRTETQNFTENLKFPQKPIIIKKSTQNNQKYTNPTLEQTQKLSDTSKSIRNQLTKKRLLQKIQIKRKNSHLDQTQKLSDTSISKLNPLSIVIPRNTLRTIEPNPILIKTKIENLSDTAFNTKKDEFILPVFETVTIKNENINLRQIQNFSDTPGTLTDNKITRQKLADSKNKLKKILPHTNLNNSKKICVLLDEELTERHKNLNSVKITSKNDSGMIISSNIGIQKLSDTTQKLSDIQNFTQGNILQTILMDYPGPNSSVNYYTDAANIPKTKYKKILPKLH